MEALDLKKFAWVHDHVNYRILSITNFAGVDMVMFQNADVPNGPKQVLTVSDFCKCFQATYSVSGHDSPFTV